jgi:glycosyltransferase involved in cell wall biosynthesis
LRILHLNVLYPPIVHGGAERFVATLAEEQVKLGHDVGVVTIGKTTEPVHKQNGVEVYRVGHANLFWLQDWPRFPPPVRYLRKLFDAWNPILRRRVANAIDQFRPDIVNSHCMVGFAVDCWSEAARRNVPILHALHEFNLFCRNTNAFRDGRMCKGVCLACRITEPKRWYSRHVSSVVGVSRDVLQRHLDIGFFNHVPAERRTVIWSMAPVAIQDRPPRPAEVPLTIGFIGRIVPEKGLENLLDAVKRLPRTGWRLVIAGQVAPPLNLEKLRASVVGLPIDWLGVVPADSFYSEIDILVVPAIWADPGPLVVHEAFANAVPVIGSRIGGIMDFIEEGRTGWLYEPGDVDALATILIERLRAGRTALPQKDAFAGFRAVTTRGRVAERYVQACRELVQSTPRGAAEF